MPGDTTKESAKRLSENYGKKHIKQSHEVETDVQYPTYNDVALCYSFQNNWDNKSASRTNLQHYMRELKKPRRQRQQERHSFAYLTMKNKSFARFVRAISIFVHFAGVLVLSTMWNDLFWSCVDDAMIWWCEDMTIFSSLSLTCWFQCNLRIVRIHFASVMTLNNWEVVAETGTYIFN